MTHRNLDAERPAEHGPASASDRPTPGAAWLPSPALAGALGQLKAALAEQVAATIRPAFQLGAIQEQLCSNGVGFTRAVRDQIATSGIGQQATQAFATVVRDRIDNMARPLVRNLREIARVALEAKHARTVRGWLQTIARCTRAGALRAAQLVMRRIAHGPGTARRSELGSRQPVARRGPPTGTSPVALLLASMSVAACAP